MNRQFTIAHLGSDELLYEYRVHDNALNARAGELQIPGRLERLMTYERERAAFYQAPWAIHADAATMAWLSAVDTTPHRLRPFPVDQPIAGWPEKTLLLVHAASLSMLADSAMPAGVVTAVWFDSDPHTPFVKRVALRQRVDVCFASDALTAERLALLHPRVLAALPGNALFRLGVAFANNHAFYDNSVSRAARARRLPVMYAPSHRTFNVLIQVDSFTRGGMEQVVLDLARCLGAQPFHVTLLARGATGPAWHEARNAGIRTMTLPRDAKRSAYEQLLREHRIDLVNAHYSLFGADVAAGLGIPFVQTIHNTYVWLSSEEAAAYRAADAYTTAYSCVSANVAYYAHVRLGLPVEKMLVMPNGIDVARFEGTRLRAERDRLRAAYGLTPDDIVFLNVASRYPPKGQRFLLRALAITRASHLRARLLLVGQDIDAEYAEELKRDIRSLRLGDAAICIDHQEDTAPFYAMADAFVLPSLWEGWSLALAEAICAKLPAIATDVGAARELLTQAGGYLITPPLEDIVALHAETVPRYLRDDHPDLVRQLAEAMRAVCANPGSRGVVEAAKAQLERTKSYTAYGELFQWLIQGGQPGGARPWLREITDLGGAVS